MDSTVQVDVDIYLGKSCEYMHVFVEYPYITMVLDSYVSLMEPQL